MSRDFAQIEAAAKRMQDYQVKSEVMGMPPGYIVGFTVTLRKDYTVLISSGAANVQGLSVQLTQGHQLTGQDWVVQRIDTPNHYYIYLAKEGNVYVDIVQPTWNGQWAYYEQPDTGWRAIGKLFVKSTDIIYAVRQVVKSGSTVTVAPFGFTGEADYYCPETDAQILINAAILYVGTAYNGGTVELLEGNYNLNSDASLAPIRITLNSIKLSGKGANTILKGSGTYAVRIYGDSCVVSNLKCDSTCYGGILNNGVLSTNAINNLIENCYLSVSNTGIDVGGGQAVIQDNFLVSCGYAGINISTTNIYNKVTNNYLSDCNHALTLLDADYAICSNNYIVNSSTYAISIAAGTTSCSVIGNYCRNNGSDTGIANTNGDNFSNAGTDTQVYSNSWQSPVSGEPSLGTLHLIPEASRPSAWVLNGGTATTFTDVSFASYVPAGVKALLLKWQVVWTGNGTADYSEWELRTNGAATTDSDQHIVVGMQYDNLANTVRFDLMGQITIGCDSTGIIEYRFLAGATAVGALYLNISGYYL